MINNFVHCSRVFITTKSVVSEFKKTQGDLYRAFIKVYKYRYTV